MKKVLIVLSAMILVFSIAGTAMALNFTLDSFDVSLNDSDPGLVLWWEPILGTPLSFDLEVGQSVTADLFTIGSDETWSNTDDMVEYPISVSFDFSTPSVLDNVNGDTDGGTFLFWSYGEVKWNGAKEFNFGDGGLFTIELSDASFWLPGSDTVEATMTYEAAPVPEPATLSLMGLGLLGVAFARRRMKK